MTVHRDENDQPTFYAYDAFGRIEQVDYPDGGQVTHEYDDTAMPRLHLTQVKEDAAGTTIDTYTYTDGLGRPVQTLSFYQSRSNRSTPV